MPGLTPRRLRFGAFEFDPERGELRKQGLRVRLQDQPFQVLAALLECPGEVVSREELIRRIWPDGTIVDFDRGLNAAVTRLRQALSDSADAPRYVETAARRGYRFLVPVEVVGETPQPVDMRPSPPEAAPASPARFRGAIVLVVVIAALGAWWLGRPSWQHGGDLWKSALLTGGAGEERNPSFSPDGTQVVYEWEREGGHHLYLKGVGPGDPIALTSGPGADYGPAWSPDGKWIAFLRQMDPTQFALFVIAPVGGTPRQVAGVKGYPLGVLRRPYRRLDWTRDSRHLIVSAFEGKGSAWERLLLVSVETGAKTWLTEPLPDVMFGDREPAVSPDGKLVAFARGVLGNEALYVAPLAPDLRLGVARPIAGGQGVRSPTWMDGRRLLVTNLKPGVSTGFALGWFDLDSAKPLRSLPELGINASTPSASTQGRLGYSTRTSEGTIWRQGIPFPGAPAPPPIKVSSAAAIQLEAQYSPDGSRIAFASERSGIRQIWNCASDGEHCVQVTFFNRPVEAGCPRWSPDGKQIAFQSLVDGPWNVYVVDANGGAPRSLTSAGPHGNVPYWSHDGKWIYYSSPDNVTRQLWKVPVAGAGVVRVADNGAFAMIESYDSKYLYYLKTDPHGKLYRSAVDGSGEKEVLTGVGYWAFALAADRIYYLHDASDGKPELRQSLLSTGEDSRVAPVDKRLTTGLSASPDGKSVIFSELQIRSSLMVAETVH